MRRTIAVLVLLIVMLTGLVNAVPGNPDQNGMLADLDLLLKPGDRASGSDNEAFTATLIADRFRELGLQVETQHFVERGIQSQNIIGIKPGSDPQAGVITVTAHYDSAASGVPGANDNASGTVVMLELARLWSDRVTSSTIQFIAFGAEERGLLGAQYYIGTPLAENVVLNLNLDMVGKGGKVSLDRAPAWLIKAISQSARAQDYPFVLHYGSMAALRTDGSPTDSRPFAAKGIPTVSLASSEGLEDDHYHSPADNRANVTGEDLMRIAMIVNDLLERYDGQRVPWGDKDFIAFTVLGRLVLLPGWLSYATIAVALIAWVVFYYLGFRGGRSIWASLRQATVRWIAMVAVTLLVVMLRARFVPGSGYPWHYLVALLVSMVICWLIDGRSELNDEQGRTMLLTVIGIPVALMLFFVTSLAWDYALMVALVTIPAVATTVSTCRWRRLLWWVAALIPFLYFAASNWLPRAGMIRMILELAYIPTLALMAVPVVKSWAKAR